MLHSSGKHLHGVPLLFHVLPGCVDYMRYMRESALYRNDTLSTMQPCTAPWITITAIPSSTMLIQAPVTTSQPAPALPQTAAYPATLPTGSLQNCTDINRASSLSTWPNPRSNKNQQISLGCAILSLRKPCIHSPASVMPNIAPAYLHLYFSPFSHGEICVFICLVWLCWSLEAPVSGRRNQEGSNHRLCRGSCFQLPGLFFFFKPARMATQPSVSLQIPVCPYRVPLTEI